MPDVFTVSVLGFKQRNSLSKEKKFCKVLSGHSNTVSCLTINKKKKKLLWLRLFFHLLCHSITMESQGLDSYFVNKAKAMQIYSKYQ